MICERHSSTEIDTLTSGAVGGRACRLRAIVVLEDIIAHVNLERTSREWEIASSVSAADRHALGLNSRSSAEINMPALMTPSLPLTLASGDGMGALVAEYIHRWHG